MEFKSEIVCQELCFSVSSACEKHILITLKWIIVTHDHAANQFVALLGINTFISRDPNVDKDTYIK